MKDKYVIEGRIIPERVDANIPIIKFTDFTIQICKSKIFIVADIEKDKMPDFRNSIFSAVGDIVNFIGFLTTTAVSYEIESAINIKTNEIIVFGAEDFVFDGQDSDLEKQVNLRKIEQGTSYELSLPLVLNPHVARATFELRNAIRYPDFTAMHCRLALEAIRNHFCEDFEKKGWEKGAWEKMRMTLRIREDCLRSFKDIATVQRHGRNCAQTWTQRQVCMQIAWEALHRFLIYVKNEETALTRNEYPDLALKWSASQQVQSLGR